MSTDKDTTPRTSPWTRWRIPAFAVLCGVAYLVAGLRGGNRTFALVGLGLMLAVAAAFVVLGRRSETVRGLLDRRDERINRIDDDATGFAGLVLILAVLAGFVHEIARGQDGQPFALLGAVAGIAYGAAVVVLRTVR